MSDLFFAWTQILLLICSLVAAIIGKMNKKKFKEMRYLFIYPAASFVETFTSPIINFEGPKLKGFNVPDMLTNIFLLLEFIIIYHYFNQILIDKKIKRILRLITIIYVPFMFFIWIWKKSFFNNASILYVPQAICILIPSFYYFFQLIIITPINDYKYEPNFWIVIGLTLYFGCTLPLFLLNGFINFSIPFERSIFSINFLCYSILYMFLTKAFLCKKRELL